MSENDDFMEVLNRALKAMDKETEIIINAKESTLHSRVVMIEHYLVLVSLQLKGIADTITMMHAHNLAKE